MEFGRRLTETTDRNVGREHSVACPEQISGGMPPGHGKVNHLAHSVHTGVSPPGCVDSRRASHDAFQSKLKGALNRWEVLLQLPSVISGTVIFDDGHISDHFVRWFDRIC
jgi:hypothetical protein